MRGDGDEPMSETESVALLERIVADQRKLIGDILTTNVTEVPQVWALYKEVQGYYERGMRVPDDVTLLWCDDNWGNLRRLPTADERKRTGGAGIYYHCDYVGGPRNYKWVNTVPLPRIWEQMNLALHYGADRLWIVNIGDLKPEEVPLEFFLTLAWNPDAWPKERLNEYLPRWAEREFGPTHAAEIADIVAQYAKFNGRRKPELLDPDTYSLINYQEADRVAADWRALATRAEIIYADLPESARDAFYELVLYPTKACAVVNELYVTAARNQLYAQQGRASAYDLAEQARQLFKQDRALSDYFNHTLAGGKWNHMMDQTHIGYTSWQQPNLEHHAGGRDGRHPGRGADGRGAGRLQCRLANRHERAVVTPLRLIQPSKAFRGCVQPGQHPLHVHSHLQRAVAAAQQHRRHSRDGPTLVGERELGRCHGHAARLERGLGEDRADWRRERSGAGEDV